MRYSTNLETKLIQKHIEEFSWYVWTLEYNEDKILLMNQGLLWPF